MADSWMMDELAHARPEHLDPAFVASYDRKQGYPDPAADLAAFEAHGLDATSVVVDLGAGAGQRRAVRRLHLCQGTRLADAVTTAGSLSVSRPR